MPPPTVLSRYGGWLPKSRKIHQAFFNEHLKFAEDMKRRNAAHEPAVVAFEKAIQSDPIMTLLFRKIFLQVSSENHIPDFEYLLRMMDHIVVAAPKFQIAAGEVGEPIGVPMYLLFDLLSNTDAAHDLFRMPAFNVALKNLLDSWGDYLKTGNSNNTLTDAVEGWFGTFGLASLEAGRGIFNQTYVTPDPTAINRGYTSWDNFFTREIQSTARPIDAADNKSLIHSACESTVYRIARDVKAHDQFWLKAQSYSIYDMLSIEADRTYVDQFTGGTVYQAFLSPQDYHRWRSPIDGVIEKAIVVPGTYYAVIPDAGAEADDPDLPEGDPRGALIRSQAWLTMTSARALIFIRADNPVIGLMCFIGVGMASVADGQKVKTGDEIGMFHFGGSSHALIFGPQVNVTFADNVVVDNHLLVNSIIAQVSPAAPKA
ncbi:phosphatidylserine decarboxylase [Flammula alnicola]|nr:phosphatidylserine decarboxylase [Flammula alnicola]